MLPSLFLCHGAPTLAIEYNDYTRFLQDMGKRLPRPDAVVVFTAHWESQKLAISSMDMPYETIYDFYGFPEVLYSLKYPAKGSPALAKEMQEILEKEGIPSQLDDTRGLDHGSWVLLYHLFPDADVPVVQVSVNPQLPLSEQYRIGEALSFLKKKNVLVVGSGGTVHNLRSLIPGQKNPEKWAFAFDDWLVEKVEKWDLDSLFTFTDQAPYARQAVPTLEHLVPLHISMGISSVNRKPSLLFREYDWGTLSYLAFSFE